MKDLNRLDLSVECILLQEKYKELFGNEIRNKSAQRLEMHGYKIG